MKKYLPFLLIPIFFLLPHLAFADAAPVVDPLTAWIGSVGALISGWGGSAWYLKVSGAIMLIVGSMKVPFVENILWNRLSPTMQTLLPAILGLLAGVLSLHPLTLSGLAAYAFTGLGANLLYEILDLAEVPAASNATLLGILKFLGSFIQPPAPPAPPASS